MKKFELQITTILVMVWLMAPIAIPASATANDWSESFDGSTLDGWTTFGFNRTAVPPDECPANYSLNRFRHRLGLKHHRRFGPLGIVKFHGIGV